MAFQKARPNQVDDQPHPEDTPRKDGRFVKGHAPYRSGGRPKTAHLKAALLSGIKPDEVAEFLLGVMRDDSLPTSQRLAAIKLIGDYREGRPAKPRR